MTTSVFFTTTFKYDLDVGWMSGSSVCNPLRRSLARLQFVAVFVAMADDDDKIVFALGSSAQCKNVAVAKGYETCSLRNLFTEKIQVPTNKTASTSRRNSMDYYVEAHFQMGMWNSTTVNNK